MDFMLARILRKGYKEAHTNEGGDERVVLLLQELDQAGKVVDVAVGVCYEILGPYFQLQLNPLPQDGLHTQKS